MFGALTMRLRWFLPVLVLAQGSILIGGAALAQTQSGPSPLAPGDLSKPIFDTTKPDYDTSGARRKGANTIVAEVDGRDVTLGEASDAIRALPPSMATMPFDIVYPIAIDQLVKQRALVVEAQRLGLDDDLEVKRRMKSAADRILVDELLRREGARAITEIMLLDRYKRDFANKPGSEEVHLRIIMAPTESEARALLDEVNKGGDFPTIAKRSSKDATAVRGGDLGFVRRDGVNAEIAAVAFSLPAGQTSAYPVASVGAWFLVKTEARRATPPPTFSEVRPIVMQDLLREHAPTITRNAMSRVVVRQYGIAGKESEDGSAPR